MTIPAEQVRYVFQGPYSVGDIVPIPFSYLAPEHVHVLKGDTDFEVNVEYSITGQNITLNIPIASNETIAVYRMTPMDNDADFPQESKFPSEKIADAIDKLTMQNQEQAEALDRALKFSRNIDPELIEKIAFPESNPGKGIKWDEDGALANTEEDIDFIVEQATTQANIAKDSAALASQEAAIALDAATQAEETLQQVETRTDEALIEIGEFTAAETLEAGNAIEAMKQEAIRQVEDSTQDVVAEAQSWAIGDNASRPEGSAKYWAEVSKEAASFDTYTKSEIDGALNQKQDTITAGEGLVKNGATLSVNTNILVTEEEFNQFKTLNTAELNTKQNTLTAGSGIAIVDNVISATGGGGGGGVSVDAYTKAETDTLLSTKQNTLTAGNNIAIEGDTIECTLETYTQTEIQGLLGIKQNALTAGDYIDITGNVISATPEDMIKGYTEEEWAALSEEEKAEITLAVIEGEGGGTGTGGTGGGLTAAEAANAAMPSGTYITLELGATGTTYIAPANGYFFLKKKVSSSNQSITMISSNIEYSQTSNYDTQTLFVSCPVRKDQTIAIWYSAAGDTTIFRFVYAQGEV